MAYFDKPIKFKNFRAAASTSDYHLRLYKTRDEDDMHMIELSDEANLKFIYRLRLTPKAIEKICLENGISRDCNFILKYIQEFISSELSDQKQWLTCEINAEKKECNICFYEVQRNLGQKCMLKLTMIAVEKEEFTQYIMDVVERYKKRYFDKKQEYEEQRKKLEYYEKKIQQMKKEVEEGNELKKELKLENFEQIEFQYKRLKANYERQKREMAEIIEEKEELEQDYINLETENEKTEEEADKLARKIMNLEDKNKDLANKNEALQDDIEDLENENKKNKNLKEAIREIADKCRKHEARILKDAYEIEELQKQLSQYKNLCKIFKAENSELLKEISNKDSTIVALTNEVENFTMTKEFTDKLILELKENQKPPTVATTESLPASTKTAAKSRPWAIVDQNLQFKKR